MIAIRKLWWLGILLIGLTPGLGQDDSFQQFKSVSPYGQFAPADAFLPGDSLPYYGSENEWNRRMFSRKAAEVYYKRRGQRQLLMILDGHPEETVCYCLETLRRDPDDLESLFNLTIAYCQTGQLKDALKSMQTALEKGLPWERFLAGPRVLLNPLYQLPEFQAYRKNHPVELLHGPLLGSVTDTGARFWVRTAGAANVQVIVYRNQKVVAHSEVISTSEENDFTGVLTVSGLQPKTQYRYQVQIDGKPAFRDSLTYFETFPTPGRAARFRVGFGGGAGYNPPNERIWDVILSQKILAFLFLGDNVYIDMPESPGPFHQYTYYRRQSRPEFRRLVSRTAIYAIWDDHDAAIDDVWLGPYRDKPDWKMPLLRFFQQNWNNPYYGDREWPGCWSDFSIGDVDFFMLDGRTYRTNPFAQQKTMLGPVQKKWLFQKLKASRATFKVIASPVPWAFEAKPGSRDTWNGFVEEREEIFHFLTENNIKGVILLSADRHRSDVWRIDRQGDYPLYEFESSKLTNIHTHELEPGALFGYNQSCSFGLLEFDTTKDIPMVTYRIVSIDGQVVYEITLLRKDLE